MNTIGSIPRRRGGKDEATRGGRSISATKIILKILKPLIRIEIIGVFRIIFADFGFYGFAAFSQLFFFNLQRESCCGKDRGFQLIFVQPFIGNPPIMHTKQNAMAVEPQN